MPAGRRPDWIVKCLNKENGDKGDLGVGWTNDDGSVQLIFNPFVVVPTARHYAIRVFKVDPNERVLGEPPATPSPGPRPAQPQLGDDIPF